MHVRIFAIEYKFGNKYHLYGERFDPAHVYASARDALLWAVHIAVQVGANQLHVLVEDLVHAEIAPLKGIIPTVAIMALIKGSKIKKLIYFFPGRE